MSVIPELFLLLVVFNSGLDRGAVVQTFPTLESCRLAGKIVGDALPGFPQVSCTKVSR